MNKILLTAIALAALVAGSATEASAVVCARGVNKAGCIGPRGAVVARRGVYPLRRGVTVRRYGRPGVAVRRF
jgi:hypothetical protein